jgi:PmbA protein
VTQYPVHEITIAVNLADMLMNNGAIGAEQETRGSVQTRAVLIENMQIAGE